MRDPCAEGADWNVVASAREGEFRAAIRALGEWGPVHRTPYYNVLVLRVDEPSGFAERFAERVRQEPGVLNCLARVVPCEVTFDFADAAGFEEEATRAVLAWADRLAGKSFHVRMHRRGFKKQLSSQTEEQRLDGALLQALEQRGAPPGRITFDDPDAIVAVETVGGRAGMSCWTREELRRYPFLGLD
ncbi:MAG: hypothetical protein Kow0092_34950 [Deferrisomatales bacterium]